MADYGENKAPVGPELQYQEHDPKSHCEGRFPVPSALGKCPPVPANEKGIT